MKTLVVSVFAILVSLLAIGQEFVYTDLNLDLTPVSSCASCDGECILSMPDSEEYTYRWNDESGGILLIETSTSGSSTLSNLCLGSYQVIVSSGSEVVNETYFSITEENVNLGSPGSIYSCDNFETVDFSTFFPEALLLGASWLDEDGLGVVGEVSTDDLTQLYELEINNNGCVNKAIYPVVVNEPADAGDGTVYIICEDFLEFNLIQPMAGDPDLNGVWLNSNDQPTDGLFDPSSDDSEIFTYLIDSVVGCDNSFATLSIIKNILPQAGEDQSAFVCSISGTEIDLNQYLDQSADSDGDWYDQQNNLVNNIIEESELEEGPYRYTVSGNIPCGVDISYVDVIFVDEINSGESSTVNICSNEQPVELISLLSGNPNMFGSWFNSNGIEVDNAYLPESGISDVYEYHVTGLGCDLEISNLEILNETFYNAGLDTNLVICEDGQLLNLSEYFTGDDINSGSWWLDELELLNTSVDPEIGQNSFTYQSNHTVCPTEQAVISVSVDDNPAYPLLEDVFVCNTSEEVNLTEEAGLSNSSWDVIWMDENFNLISEVFDPEIDPTANLQLSINSNNSCPDVNSGLTVFVEENSFLNQGLVDEVCSTQDLYDLNNIIPDELNSSQYELVNTDGDLSSVIVPIMGGLNEFRLVEVGLVACEPSEIALQINVIEFQDAGASQSLSFCESDESFELSSQVSAEGQWMLNDEVLDNTQIELAVENSSVYEFVAFNNAVCAESMATYEISISPIFDYVALPDLVTCENQTVLVQEPVNSEEYNLQWNYEVESSVQSVELLGLVQGNQSVIYNMSNDLCSVTDSFSVEVVDPFVPQISAPSIVCSGEEVLIQLLNDFQSSIWFLGDVEIGQDLSQLEFIANNTSEVVVELVSDIGCEADVSVFVMVNQTPQLAINDFELTQCAPFSINLSNQYALDDNTNYSWVVNQETYNYPSYILDVDEGEVYDVSLAAFSSNGCSNTIDLNAQIIGWENPYASFETQENELSYLNPITEFSNKSENFEIVNWYVDDNYINSYEDLWQYEFPDVQYESYEVCLEAISEHGCQTNYCESVFVNAELLVYVPNAFTPNGDGINETFFAEMKGFSKEEFQLIVFDRWGEEIYMSTDPSSEWIGNVKGGDYYAQPGVYSYSIAVKSQFTAELEYFKGLVTLIR